MSKVAVTHKSGSGTLATFLGLLTRRYQGPEGPIRLLPGIGMQLILQTVESGTTERVLVVLRCVHEPFSHFHCVP